MPADFQTYIRSLASVPLDEKTEQTDRAALETLLRQSADDAEPGAQVQHEPRRDKSGAGSPDFKVTRAGRIAGYFEVKAIDENLSKVLRSEQIKKYRTLTDNLILTDYLDFAWIRPDGEVTRERLAYADDLSARKLALKPERVEAVRTLLRGFFSAVPARIGKGQVLAVALARRGALLRDFLSEELQRQVKEHREGRLLALYEVFKTQVFHNLTIGAFADAFAQMLAYSLFLARLNAGPKETVTLENVRTHIPGSFALIRELVRFLDEMNEDSYRDIRWVIVELLSIVNGLDLAAIRSDLSFRSRKAISRKVRAGDEEEHRLFERDPFIYFYEDFLKAYDPAMRKGRGVYYTPPPVVNFIIRAIDDILKNSFGIEKGLADHQKVTVLDFACGTGTFLLEVFERVFETIGGPEAGNADLIVREHLLKNLYGFEYLIAPYTIAHLKLSQYLKDKGHPLKGDERLQVFLTNTLEPVAPLLNKMLPELSAEVKRAQEIKDKPILVIMGNPPYSAKSKNNGGWITDAIEPYKIVNGKHFGERKHWLHDDYVKFLRFAQMKMDDTSEGVVGVITNHSWLDNPTFRGMRQSLMYTFDQIYVLDLHGNAKKKERSPDGSRDENVFDIEQGVAISIFVKRSGAEKGVWRGDLWGKRDKKYLVASTLEFSEAIPDALHPTEPYYLFKIETSIRDMYNEFLSINKLFRKGVSGIVTARDGLVLAPEKHELAQRVRNFISGRIDAPPDTRGWSSAQAKLDLVKTPSWTSSLRYLGYHPFDARWAAYDRRLGSVIA